MIKQKLLPEEQEVSIVFDNENDNARMYASIPKWIRKMDKMCAELPGVFECIRRDEVSATYTFPKKNVSIRKGNPSIVLSPEEKERRRKNMQENSKHAKNDDSDEVEDDFEDDEID